MIQLVRVTLQLASEVRQRSLDDELTVVDMMVFKVRLDPLALMIRRVGGSRCRMLPSRLPGLRCRHSHR